MAGSAGFSKFVILAVLVLVAGAVFWVLRPQGTPPAQAPAPVGYYQARGPAPIPPTRDMLGYDGASDPAPVPVSTAGIVNDNGLMIGALAGTMRMTMDGLGPNNRIPAMSTCHRSNQSPAISWSGAPARTRSFVVMFEKIEPDGKNHLYWSVYNIDASTTSIPPALAQGPDIAGIGSQGKNHTENIGYIGPCIPRGEHPFQIRVFALDTRLNLQGGATRDELVKHMNGHIIDMARLPLVHLYRM
jgi:Raf kinase inhibitor-like YbhB/YbcL family protein